MWTSRRSTKRPSSKSSRRYCGAEQRKIEDWRLDDSPREVFANYVSTKFAEAGLKINFNNWSFQRPPVGKGGPYEVYLRGTLFLFNTKEAYEAADAASLYRSLA